MERKGELKDPPTAMFSLVESRGQPNRSQKKGVIKQTDTNLVNIGIRGEVLLRGGRCAWLL